MVNSTKELISIKKQLRQEMLAIRSLIHKEQVAQVATEATEPSIYDSIKSVLLNYYSEFVTSEGKAKCGYPQLKISGYSPINSEFNCTPILHYLHSLGHHCLLPVVKKKHTPLAFRKWLPDTTLTPGTFGVLVPLEDEASQEESCTPDLLLTPLLAFDKEGHRLGYGGGFYDRTIAFIKTQRCEATRETQFTSKEPPPVVVCGIGYSGQEQPAVPHNESDALLDCLLTEKGVLYFKSAENQNKEN